MEMIDLEETKQSITIEDISADLNDLESYVEDLTSFIPLPLITLNPALKIIDINNSFLSATHYTQYEVLSESIGLLFKNKHDIDNIIRKTQDSGIIKNYETIIFTKEKKEISVSVSSVLRTDEDGIASGYFIAFIDISELKKIEKSLQEKVDRLQKNELATLNIMEDLQKTIQALTKAQADIHEKNNELQKINTELASAREELTILNRDLEKKVQERTADVEKLLKQKDEFVSQLGHDLKTPLTPLNILIPVVKEKEQDPKLKELLTVIFNNVQYMKNLVIKTLELAQLNSPNTNFEFEDIYLSDQITTILDMEKILNQGKTVVFENNIQKNIVVKADPIQIKELFNNLISNAKKYSQEDTVKITFDATQKDDCIIVSVKDTGIGLESHQIPHIFDEFYKVDYSRHDLQSTGLGLSICKRIIEKHGGRIWAESPGKGQGSTFFFTLKSPGGTLHL